MNIVILALTIAAGKPTVLMTPQVTLAEQRVCPVDPKLCSYYICRHRWPPAECE